MNMKFWMITGLLCLSLHAFSQSGSNTYGLKILTGISQLQQTIATDSNKRFVRIKDYVPGIMLDIKYAGTENVFYEQLYEGPYALIRLPAAKALARVQAELAQHDVGLKIYDAYRPYSVTCRMFEILPDTIYMGLPSTGSKHNRGIALDLTLMDLETKKELKMPTPFDALVYASHPKFMGLPEAVIRNRELLMTTMQKHGFSVDPVEWWHYNFIAGAKYELLDIPHKQIEAGIAASGSGRSITQ